MPCLLVPPRPALTGFSHVSGWLDEIKLFARHSIHCEQLAWRYIRPGDTRGIGFCLDVHPIKRSSCLSPTVNRSLVMTGVPKKQDNNCFLLTVYIVLLKATWGGHISQEKQFVGWYGLVHFHYSNPFFSNPFEGGSS